MRKYNLSLKKSGWVEKRGGNEYGWKYAYRYILYIISPNLRKIKLK